MSVVCITASASSRLNDATSFATEHDLPFCSDHCAALQLQFSDDGIVLFDTELDTGIHIDFISGAVAHRERYGGGKGQAIARAIGLNKHDKPAVLDVTAGLGRDAWVLASLGCQMTLVEQSPMLHAMLQEAIFKAQQSGSTTANNIKQLVNSNSIDYLKQLANSNAPDVIYIDPMYPERQKSALVKKDMQILHKLIGPAADEEELLNTARDTAGKRVVVKRPGHAEAIGKIKPTHTINSKKTRYDVYMCS